MQTLFFIRNFIFCSQTIKNKNTYIITFLPHQKKKVQTNQNTPLQEKCICHYELIVAGLGEAPENTESVLPLWEMLSSNLNSSAERSVSRTA